MTNTPPHFYFTPPPDKPNAVPLGEAIQASLRTRIARLTDGGDGHWISAVRDRTGIIALDVIHRFPFVDDLLCIAHVEASDDTADGDFDVVCSWCGDRGRVAGRVWVGA